MSVTLKGTVREKLGSRWARRLRLDNRIPCSIQGENKENVDIAIDAVAFSTARRQHQHLFDIELDKGPTETAMIRELQWDTLGNEVVHVEFRRVVRGQKTEVEVALEFTGRPKGGVLNHLVSHLTIMCLPSEIPDNVEVSVEGLEEGHTIHAGDLELAEGFELVTDAETPVAVVTAVRGVEEAPTEGEEEELGAIPAGPGTDEGDEEAPKEGGE